jgi:site-specific recombinase XerD
MSSHSQRHTVANLLLKMDVSMYTIKETLNHSSVNTTQIYFHKGTGFDKSDSSNALIDKLF